MDGVYAIFIQLVYRMSCFFPTAWRRVFQRRWLSLKSGRYMDDVMDGVMDDARMDGAMDVDGFRGFAP